MGLGSDDAEVVYDKFKDGCPNCNPDYIPYGRKLISVNFDHYDPEIAALTAVREIIERAQLSGSAIVRLGEWLKSYGANHSFRSK